jgi:hypothetical protein
MPDDPKSSVTETDPQPKDSAPASDGAIDGMLAAIPGLDKYFGATESEEKPKPGVPATTEEQEVTPVPQEEGKPAEEEPAHEEKVPAEQESKEEEDALPASVQKRIDRLTAQKHEALEKAEALGVKVKELEERIGTIGSLAPTPEDPLANVHSVEDLVKRLEAARKVKSWALEHLDGGEVQTEKGETQYLDGSQVKKWLSLSESLITEYIPQRKQYLESRALFDREAKNYYPNLFKSGTEENTTLATWVRLLPEVLRFPDFQLMIADALVGQKIRFAKTRSGNSNGAKPAKPATLAAPSPSSGSKVPEKSVLSKDLLNRMASDRSALDAFSESLIGRG